MADSEYKPVVDLDMSMHALGAVIDVRRGYVRLIEQMIAPYPLQHQYDQTKRNELITLLSRSDTLWVLVLIHSESPFAGHSARQARARRKQRLGEHLTRAAIARGLAIVEAENDAAETARRHTVAASRLVEAGLAFGLFELGEKPDAKQQPIVGTSRLAQFLHALGDHSYWSIKEALDNAEARKGPSLAGVREAQSEFEPEVSTGRRHRRQRITRDDVVMDWLFPKE